jgi:hypothetical protein
VTAPRDQVAPVGRHHDVARAGAAGAFHGHGGGVLSCRHGPRVRSLPRLPPAPRVRLLRDAEPLGPRQRPPARAARVPGAGHDQRRVRLVARPARPPRIAGGGPGPSSFHRAGRRGAGQRGFRGRLRRRAGRCRSERRGRDGHRGRRAVDRGFHGRRCGPALRALPRGRAYPGRPAGDRREWDGRPAHRPIRGVHRRASGSRGDVAPGPTSRRW